MKKKFFAMLLATGMTLGVLPSLVSAAVVGSGKCGDTVTWKFDSDGTLTISGTGAMDNYNNEISDSSMWSPWRSYIIGEDGQWKENEINSDDIINIVIEDGVTHIGDDAFMCFFNLKSVKIPNSVTSIGVTAFEGCESLTNITLPDSVVDIGERAFSMCYSLTNIEIPNSVMNIGEAAFMSNKKLISINVGEGNLSYTSENGVLFNKDKTKLITYPCGKVDKTYKVLIGTETIEDYAFFNCSNLTDIEVPDSVTSIGHFAFLGVSKDIYYSGTKEQWENVLIYETKMGTDRKMEGFEFRLPINKLEKDDNFFTGLTVHFNSGSSQTPAPTPAPQENKISVFVNGTELNSDQPPVIVDDRTLVPLRAIFEALGADVNWDGTTKTVTSSKGGDTVSLKIGDNTLYKNGEAKTLDVPAQIINDRTMVPVRAISEAYGCNVGWDGATKTVTISA